MAPRQSDDDAPPAPDRRRWLWTPRQRRALAGLVLAGCALLAAQLSLRPAAVPDPPASHPPHYEDLVDRLDPNAATVEELGVLPGVGRSKAQAIIDYRESASRRPAFRTAADLSRVRGIGPAIVARLAPYLTFPDPAK